MESVKSVVEELHGDDGRATVFNGLRTIYCNSATGICLVQVRAGRPHALLASAVPFLKSVKGHKVIPRTIYTGATIRNCYKVKRKFHFSTVQICLWISVFAEDTETPARSTEAVTSADEDGS